MIKVVDVMATGQIKERASVLQSKTQSALRFLKERRLCREMDGRCHSVWLPDHGARRLRSIGSSCPWSAETEPPEDIFFQTATCTPWSFEDKVILFYADSPDSRARGRLAEDRIEAQQCVGQEPLVPEEQWRNLEQIIMNYSAGDSSRLARLKEISHPTLIMNGDRDPCYPLQNQLLLHRETPDSRLAILPMAGHGPQHKFPQECATMIDGFLSA